VGICLILGVVAGVTAVYMVSKACKPKYYWMMDPEDSPPRFWLGTHSNKEVQIQGWKRIGGPYDRIEDAPTQPPNATNRVSHLSSEPTLRVSVQQSQDSVNWVTVHTEVSQIDEVVYYPTNTGFFRLEAGLP